MGGRFVCVFVVAAVIGCGGSNRQGPQDAPADTEVVGMDSALGNGAFGDPCTKHGDCVSGYCVEPSPGYGGVCTMTCTDSCPTSYDCLSVTYPGSTVMLCVPNAARLCSSCATDTECPGGACLSLDSSNKCASSCNSQADCPSHYTCAADPSGTHTGNYCQPATGSCSCNNGMDGAIRSCSNANAIGTCWGTQTCAAATGWSACTAATAAAETCDGVDNDCNFLIDDGVGGGTTCAITNGFGSCAGVQVCDGTQGFVCHGQMPTMETCNSIDDNCNGTIDEGFAGLGQACTAGVGACLRYGANSCNSTHDGTVCSAVAGTATTELCNHIDDDCNGVVDNGFPTLGMSCSAGMGVCTRYGSNVCNSSGSGVQCSATAGTNMTAETCNYLDDDCNGTVDDGFRDPVTGLYSLTNGNCGACGNNCATQYTVSHSSGVCSVVSSTAQCTMACTSGYFDLDASTLDGCEFFLDATVIYVAGADVTAVDDATCGLGPTGTGAGNHPCKTITYGLGRAMTAGRANVQVANATYNEGVTLISGKNLLGGYTSTFSRDLANTSTVIQGFSQQAPHQMTVNATNITAATLFEGFVIRGSDNVSAHGNSYGIYVSNGGGLTIRANQIFSGRGGPGGTGSSGTKGTAGNSGTAYVAAQFDSFAASKSGNNLCSNTNPARAVTTGGTNPSCSVPGGNGGGNQCTPSPNNQTSATVGTAGTAGAGAGGGTAGTAGARGYDQQLGDGVAVDNSTCFVAAAANGTLLPTFGADGNPGGDGGNAAGVLGCSTTAGTVTSGHWIGSSGLTGNTASNGGGGGGGGAGGGSTCVESTGGTTCTSDWLGGRGGAGGAGGCGGTGGVGGTAGGGSFAIFVTAGTAPAITGNSIVLGTGGIGGSGGLGGAGGLGGVGTAGGQVGTFFCSGKGGRGGDGGTGGAGSGGGGGCGGNSYGIYTSGIGTSLTYCQAAANNTMSGGGAGAGGSGGSSGGAAGGNGTAGVLANCSFN